MWCQVDISKYKRNVCLWSLVWILTNTRAFPSKPSWLLQSESQCSHQPFWPALPVSALPEVARCLVLGGTSKNGHTWLFEFWLNGSFGSTVAWPYCKCHCPVAGDQCWATHNSPIGAKSSTCSSSPLWSRSVKQPAAYMSHLSWTNMGKEERGV